MDPQPSPYAVLGLEPGAGPAAVETAYKRLIKRHHPDRQGGDAAKAAEIIKAYREIRRRQANARLPVRADLGRGGSPPQRARHRWWPVLLGGLAALALIQREAIGDAFRFGDTLEPGRAGAAIYPYVQQRRDRIEAPLDSDGIDRSVRDAVRLVSAGSEERLASQSRLCHQQLRREPDASRFDRCVAFDEAVMVLLGRDPFDERGQFGASSVTARQLASASSLSKDSLAIDSRLGRIRTQVDLTLAPANPQPVPAASAR